MNLTPSKSYFSIQTDRRVLEYMSVFPIQFIRS